MGGRGTVAEKAFGPYGRRGIIAKCDYRRKPIQCYSIVLCLDHYIAVTKKVVDQSYERNSDEDGFAGIGFAVDKIGLNNTAWIIFAAPVVLDEST